MFRKEGLLPCSGEDPEASLSQRRETETEKSESAETHSLSLSDLSVSSKSNHALRADPELPFLDMAWSPSQMQEFFNHQVLPAVWPGQQVAAVAIDDIHYKPGKQCQILYSLRFADPTRGQSRWAGVTFANENELGEIYRYHYGGESSSVAGSTPRPVVFLPRYGCLVEFFPMDWKLPFLAQAIEPGEMAPLLFQGGPAAKRSRALPKVEVLRYLPHSRCVLRYTMEDPDGGAPTEVIGKVHESGSLAVRVAQTQSILQAQGAAYGIIIPKPLRVIEEGGFLLMERVPGTEIKPAVRQARAPLQLTEVIGLVAAALASLHRLHFESQKVQSLQTLLKKCHSRVAPLQLVAPLLAQQAEALLQQIAQLSVYSPEVAPSFLHGGFGPGQLLVDKGQVAVVDFDSAGLGDPAIDVGKFMAKLHRSAVASRAGDDFRQLAAYFLAEYQARLPEHRVAERVHLFLSATLVRLAIREFERCPYDYGRAGADSLPARLLQEAAACLSRQ